MEEREWFAENFEKIHGEEFGNERKINSAKLMLKSQVNLKMFTRLYICRMILKVNGISCTVL